MVLSLKWEKMLNRQYLQGNIFFKVKNKRYVFEMTFILGLLNEDNKSPLDRNTAHCKGK